MLWWPYVVGGVVLVAGLVFYLITDHGPKRKIDLKSPDTHVVITGGSSGIGLATAIDIAKLGARVTLIARDRKKLESAAAEIKSKVKGAQVEIVSADISDRLGAKHAIEEATAKAKGRLDVLIMSAGVSRPGKIEDTDPVLFESMIRINYLGALYCSLAATPIMKAQGYGRLMFVSSLAGLAGMVGFAGYASSKFAVRGLAHVLQMELRPFDIYTSLVNPPDVDTPMLREEMQWKPEETKIISEGAGLFKAEDISRDIVSAIKSWKFMVNTGFEGWLAGLGSADVSTPTHSVFRTLAEVFLAGPLRFVGLIYLFMWNRTCTQVHKKQKKEKSS